MAAVPQDIRDLCLQRAGFRCEKCHGSLEQWFGYSLQHRIARGMGGSKDERLSGPANLIVLCGSGTTGCHGLVESQRRLSIELGYAMHRGDDPTEVLFQDDYGSCWQLLADGEKILVVGDR